MLLYISASACSVIPATAKMSSAVKKSIPGLSFSRMALRMISSRSASIRHTSF